MTSAEEARAFLLTLYGDRWKAKVKKMPEAQVIAVYARMQTNEAKRRKAKKENPR